MKKFEHLSPMYQYYFKVQEEYPDAIVCMQLGDFYEIWEEVNLKLGYAKKAAHLADMRLTKRNKSDPNSPDMCGFPVHTKENYIHKLVEAGESVVVISQKTNGNKHDKNKKVERYIERIVTPGTKIDYLAEEKANYFACLYVQDFAVGVSIIDLSTGEVEVSELLKDEVNDYFKVINPSEVLICGNFDQKINFLNRKMKKNKIHKLADCGSLLSHIYDLKKPNSNDEYYLSLLGLEQWRLATLALANLVNYLASTDYYTVLLKKIAKPKILKRRKHLSIPLNGYRSLEILEGQNGKSEDSLVYHLDKCKTAMGRRLLRQYLREPLLDIDEIKVRQKEVLKHIKNNYFFDELRSVYDISRMARRIFLGNLSPYEMKQLYESLLISKKVLEKEKQSLTFIDELINFLEENIDFKKLDAELDSYNFFKGNFLNSLSKVLNNKNKEYQLLQELKDKYDKLIQNHYSGKASSKKFRIEKTKESYKLKGPKGFYDALKEAQIDIKMQVRASSVELVDSDWIEASNRFFAAEQRFLIKAKKEWEELQVVLRDKYAQHFDEVANDIARIDVLSNFAKIALERDYCQPELIESESSFFEFKDLRHPVVEQSVNLDEEFIPNDISLGDNFKIMCIYGANSSGKSTLLKSIALNIIMAQMGSFVPCSSFKLSPFEYILTRMTTFDSLSEGLSTFTMEMKELQIALKHKDSKSLFLLDEIGRGTSVEDGEALAFSTLDYLSSSKNSISFFATHYHNLKNVLSGYENIVIKHMDCYLDESGFLYFSRELKEGSGKGSYGIHVASSCGLPEELIRMAKNYDKQFAPLKKSNYNKKVKGILCPLCYKNPVQETHHIQEQKQGKVEKVSINNIKRKIHHKDNLIMICSSCHEKITRGEMVFESKKDLFKTKK